MASCTSEIHFCLHEAAHLHVQSSSKAKGFLKLRIQIDTRVHHIQTILSCSLIIFKVPSLLKAMAVSSMALG